VPGVDHLRIAASVSRRKRCDFLVLRGWEISRSSKRVYRGRNTLILGAVWIVIANAIALGAIVQDPGSVRSGAIGFRFVRSGVEVFDAGIRVRNVFSTLELPWQQIEKFEIGDSGLLPMVCLIRLKGAETRRAVGIQERTNCPSGSAEAIVEELNSELAKHAGADRPAPDEFDSQ